MKQDAFKVCPTCGHVWPTREQFLSDPNLVLAGYQAHFEDLEGGLFFFTHATENCGTTLAIEVKQFTGLSSRPMLNKRTIQPEGCENLCMREGCFNPCPIQCECSWVREILHMISTWRKTKA